LFERAGLLRHEQAKIVLKEYVDSENLDGEGSFETVELVSVEQEKFESRLQDEIVELIYDSKVDEEQAKSLADDLDKSISEQYR
jgi:GTPase involved in cell partitioning and DNA repair